MFQIFKKEERIQFSSLKDNQCTGMTAICIRNSAQTFSLTTEYTTCFHRTCGPKKTGTGVRDTENRRAMETSGLDEYTQTMEKLLSEVGSSYVLLKHGKCECGLVMQLHSTLFIWQVNTAVVLELEKSSEQNLKMCTHRAMNLLVQDLNLSLSTNWSL